MEEISKLLQNAKEASIKVLDEKEVTTADLESIFKVISEKSKDDLLSTLSSPELTSIRNKLVKAIESAADVIVDYLYSTIVKDSIWNIFIQNILNNWNTIQTLLNDPHSLLPDDLKIADEDAIKTANNKLSLKVEEALSSMEQTNFDALDNQNLEKIANEVDKLSYLDDDIKDDIKILVSSALFGKIAPELEKYSNDFSEAIKKAINDSDTGFYVSKWRDGFIVLVRKIESKYITRWSASEKLMEECKDKFNNLFDSSLAVLMKKIVDTVIVKDLDDCENEKEIDHYVAKNKIYTNLSKNWINLFFDDDKKTEIKKYMDDTVSSARISLKSRPPRVKTYKDSEGNEYAKFKDETVPVAHHEKTNHRWKIEPKMLPNWNVVITFKDIKSGKVIEPSVEKRLRVDNPYEISVKEWKEMQKDIKMYNEKLKEIEKIRLRIEKEKDDNKKKELIKDLNEKLEKLSYFAQVLDRLSILDIFLWDYIEDKIPDFDAERIKITPDIMENLREMAECSKTMLKSQHDILILEWEAGVWKNVIIDIFAHFTNRPVFVFSCWKRTDVQDLTYLWILDENWSKKLNSKIFEAIHTPGAILVLDEINTLDPGIQKRLNGLLDARKSLVVDEAGWQKEKAEESVLILWTMNPQWYSGTQPLAQDVRSRAHFIYHDYDWLLRKTDSWNIEVSYSDALKVYGNVKYFWKLAAWNWFTQNDVELYEEALLDQIHGNRLTPEKKKILKNFKPISDSDFIWARNNLFNGWNREDVKNRFGNTFVEGMTDLYTMMLYANYIRVRYKATKEWWDDDNLPWDEETDELFDDISFSPRLAIQALEQLHNGWLTAEEAVVETFANQLTDVNNRPKVIKLFNTLSASNIKKMLTNSTVQSHLS